MAKKVLVADDEPGLVTLLETMLEMKGFDVITASTGTEALTKALREKPDVILLDIVMPGLAGYQVFEKLQEDSYTKHIPVFVMSARKNMVNLFPPSKLITFVSKPFDANTFVDMLAQSFAPQTSPEESKDVLILGNQEFLVNKIMAYFMEKGYQVTTALNEQDAIQKCEMLVPKFFFCEFWEDPVVLDSAMVYQKVKYGSAVGRIRFYIYCQQNLLFQAQQIFQPHLIVSYHHSWDLLEKIKNDIAR